MDCRLVPSCGHPYCRGHETEFSWRVWDSEGFSEYEEARFAEPNVHVQDGDSVDEAVARLSCMRLTYPEWLALASLLLECNQTMDMEENS